MTPFRLYAAMQNSSFLPIMLSIASPRKQNIPAPLRHFSKSTAHLQSCNCIPAFTSANCSVHRSRHSETYHAAETFTMPLCAQCLDHHFSDRTFAFLASRRVTVRVAVNTPCVAILLNKRCRRFEWLALWCQLYYIDSPHHRAILTSPH